MSDVRLVPMTAEQAGYIYEVLPDGDIASAIADAYEQGIITEEEAKDALDGDTPSARAKLRAAFKEQS